MGSVGGVLSMGGRLLLFLLLLKYYPEKNFLTIYFETKVKKKNVPNDLKKEPDLKSKCCFTLLSQ